MAIVRAMWQTLQETQVLRLVTSSQPTFKKVRGLLVWLMLHYATGRDHRTVPIEA